jgi:hypothetical protein
MFVKGRELGLPLANSGLQLPLALLREGKPVLVGKSYFQEHPRLLLRELPLECWNCRGNRCCCGC